MKHVPVFLILLATIAVIAGCDIFGTGDPPKVQSSDLKGFGVSGIYIDENQIIVGTSSIGSTSYIFRSGDNGASWQQVDSIHVDNTYPYNFHGTYTHTSFLGNSNTIFAGIGGGYKGEVLVSTDNGKTWTEPDPDFTENVNCFTMINGTLFTGTGHGVFMTTDNGSSWAGADTAGLSHPVVGLTTVEGSLFAATSGFGIYCSTDKGASWTEVNKANFDFTSLATIGNDLFAGAFQFYGKDSTGGVFMSSDKGASWSHADAGIPHHTVNALYSNDTDLFAGTNSGTYYSTNKGADWVFLDSLTATSFAANDTWLFVGSSNGVKRYALSKLDK